MPTSDVHQIPRILEVVRALNPDSILDVGPGFGKFGLLCREYLELWCAEPTHTIREAWRTRIDAVEIHAPYVTHLLRAIYDHVHVADAIDFLGQTRDTWDLILSIDHIEHIPQADHPLFIDAARSRCQSLVVVTPRKPNRQGPSFGNPYEAHISTIDVHALPSGSTTESVAKAWLSVIPGTLAPSTKNP